MSHMTNVTAGLKQEASEMPMLQRLNERLESSNHRLISIEDTLQVFLARAAGSSIPPLDVAKGPIPVPSGFLGALDKTSSDQQATISRLEEIMRLLHRIA